MVIGMVTYINNEVILIKTVHVYHLHSQLLHHFALWLSVKSYSLTYWQIRTHRTLKLVRSHEINVQVELDLLKVLLHLFWGGHYPGEYDR